MGVGSRGAGNAHREKGGFEARDKCLWGVGGGLEAVRVISLQGTRDTYWGTLVSPLPVF